MSLYTLIFLIVAISIASGMFRDYLKHKSALNSRMDELDTEVKGENASLRQQVKNLQERIEVLEKIVTDPRHELRRELENLEQQDKRKAS